ncbi:MAG: hypothetical protein EHM35_16700, partial [Planctomycetaceae bacterium]
MLKRVLWISSVLVIVLGAAGCIPLDIAPTGMVTLHDPAFESHQVSIAVDLQGVKHTFHTECALIPPGQRCRAIYSKFSVGQPVNTHVYYDNDFCHEIDPDIAVLDSGVAFFVWNEYYYQGPEYPENAGKYPVVYYSDSEHYLQAPTPLFDVGEYASVSPPVIAARGEVAYIVYEVSAPGEGPATYLRYQQVAGGHRSGWVSDILPGEFIRTEPALAIDNAGNLHVAYRVHLLDDPTEVASGIWHNDNVGDETDMTNLSSVWGAFYLGAPAISLNVEGDYLYFALTQNHTDSGTVRIYFCPPDDCQPGPLMGHVAVDLSASANWKIPGPLSLAPLLDRVALAFTAVNDATGPTPDIFYATYAAGGASPAAANLSNSPTLETDARMVAAVDDEGRVLPLVGYRLSDGLGGYGTVSIHPFLSS